MVIVQNISPPLMKLCTEVHSLHPVQQKLMKSLCPSSIVPRLARIELILHQLGEGRNKVDPPNAPG